MLSGWRLSDPLYATTAHQMLSGEGAFLYSGRWHSKGHRVIYLGGNLATAATELLVHLERDDVLKMFHKMEVYFEEMHVVMVEEEDLPGEWNAVSINPITQYIGDDWFNKKESLILQVPSVAVEGEINYLLNPEHSDFKDIECSEITTFKHDKRIIKT